MSARLGGGWFVVLVLVGGGGVSWLEVGLDFSRVVLAMSDELCVAIAMVVVSPATVTTRVLAPFDCTVASDGSDAPPEDLDRIGVGPGAEEVTVLD